MRTAVFLVKNGIGFGHIRRALLLAEALQARGNLRPIVISQAHSLDLYRSAPLRVVNFPLLHRVPSAVSEDCYLEILDELLRQLTPAVVVEDTYPDPRYGALAALTDVPRLLVMRRLDGLSFDQLRTRGAFARYDEVLITQTAHQFAQEGHSGSSLAAVEGTARFRFVGNIHYTPDASTARTRRAQLASARTPLVVVNAGAGGDQMPDGFGDKLFGNCHDIARQLREEGHPARFLLVTGPYYSGRPLPDTANVTVRRFEPDLAALLQSADVAVIKPGNNVLSETLLGHANLVLVPDTSFMEGLDEHAARTVDEYGGCVATPHPEICGPAIRAALEHPPRQRRTTPNPAGIDRIVDSIEHHAEPSQAIIEPRQLALLVDQDPHIGSQLAFLGQDEIQPNTVRLSQLRPGGLTTVHAVVLDADPPNWLSPQDLADAGARVLLVPNGVMSPAVSRWLDLAPAAPTLLRIALQVIAPRDRQFAPTVRRIARLLYNRPRAAVLLDLRQLPESVASMHLSGLRTWIKGQPLRTIGLEPLRAAAATDLLRADP